MSCNNALVAKYGIQGVDFNTNRTYKITSLNCTKLHLKEPVFIKVDLSQNKHVLTAISTNKEKQKWKILFIIQKLVIMK